MLYDKEFLLKLDKAKNKTIFARITALTFQEYPIETIEGRVTQGSVNIDGNSAVRRSCSLTIVAQDFQYNDFYWGLNTKFKLEVGVENNIDPSYPNIIWFKQGIYLITSFNTSRSTNNFSISIQGKDKMCLLNGEVGGSLESSVDFGTIEEENKEGVWVIRKIPIPEIIRNAVHVYGGEPLHNIIINDLAGYGLELLEYRYEIPMYLYRATNEQSYRNATLDSNKTCKVYRNGSFVRNATLGSLNSNELEMLVDSFTGTAGEEVEIEMDSQRWYVAKIEYGQTAGYRETELVYAGDLIANVGEALTSILDKIKNMLVEFEYFYDVDGRFIFQKKQSFISTMWNSSDTQARGQMNQALAIASTHSYIFSGSELITAFNNNPNLLNLRNDYSIWGERTGVSGAKIPVHIRYAIDRKPVQYTHIQVSDNHPDLKRYNDTYKTNIKGQSKSTIYASNSDWREVIYQMALDYYKYNMLSDFELLVAEANGDLYPTGRTGYENYYIDLQGFWRQLYYPALDEKYNEAERNKNNLQTEVDNLTLIVYGVENPNSDRRIGGIENYLTTMNNELSDGDAAEAYNVLTRFRNEYSQYSSLFTGITDMYVAMTVLNDLYFREKDKLENLKRQLKEAEVKYENLKTEWTENYYQSGERKYWNKAIYEKPEALNFWFDFLDGAKSTPNQSSHLSQYDVKNIGARPKAINDSNVKSIYFRETPNVIYAPPGEAGELSGFRYIQCAEIDGMFSISAQGKSAKERLDELLYQHSYCIESATITTIPIYYLQPNTRVYLHDDDTGLDGDYIVSKITLPLAYNGTMQLTATKAAENII